MSDEFDSYFIHENAHSYGLSVIRDPALAHRYVVWVQPTWDESSRFSTRMHWSTKAAFQDATNMLEVTLKTGMSRTKAVERLMDILTMEQVIALGEDCMRALFGTIRVMSEQPTTIDRPGDARHGETGGDR